MIETFDLHTLGVFVIFALGLTTLLFFVLKPEGDPYEKAYVEKERRLIEAAVKPKGPKSNKNKKKDKKNKTEEDDTDVQGKQSPAPTSDENVVPEPSAPQPAPEAPAVAVVEEKKPKKNNKNKNKKSEPAEAAPVQAVKPVEEKVVKVEEKVQQTVAPTPPPQATPVVKPEAKKPSPKKRSTFPVTTVTADNLISRLAEIDEIETAYVNFTTQYITSTTEKINSQEKKIAQLEEKNASVQIQLDQLIAAKSTTDKQNYEKQRLVVDLTAKLQLLQKSEEENQKKLATIQQSQVDVVQLKKDYAQQKKNADEAIALQAEFQTAAAKAKDEQNALSAKIAQLQKDLEAQAQTNSLLVNDLQEAAKITKTAGDLDQMKAELEKFEAVAKTVSAMVVEKDETIAQLKASLAERDDLKTEFAAQKEEWKQKETHLMTEYHNLQALVENLHKEIAQFEIYKKEQDDLREKLIAKDRELEEKRQKLAAAEIIVNGSNVDSEKLTALENENAQLKSKVEELLASLENAKHQHNEEIANLHGAASDAQEEIVILKKANSLNAAPPAASANHEDVVELKYEIQQLQAKNEELRARNFAILEKVESAKSTTANKTQAQSSDPSSSSAAVEAERALVAKLIGDAVNKKFSNTSDSKAYSSWLSTVSESIKQKQNSARVEDKENSGSQKESKKAKKQQESNHATSSDSCEEIEKYRAALTLLTNQLTIIEKIALRKEAELERKLAEATAQLKTAERRNDVSAKVIKQMQENAAIKKKIGELREAAATRTNDVTSTRFTANAVSPAVAVRSDDSDWEVVSN